MTATPMYLLKAPGNHTIEISQEQVRSLLSEIEADLHRSQVYRRVLTTLQKMLGSSDEQAKILLKAVSREAIGLAFQQFAQQQVADTTQPTNVEAEHINELSQCLTSVKLNSQKTTINTNIINPEQKPSAIKPRKQLNSNQKSTNNNKTSVKSISPASHQLKNTTAGITLDIQPIHLYLGYATLVAGAVGGLSFLSQQAKSDQTHRPDVDIQPSSSLFQLDHKAQTTVKPGLKSSNNGIVVSPGISPPEAL
ncbi:hypothetical protein [Fortiea contorta]|uniref:hypothetical protein n=1 Tax=Fortiea contorta TaxID=1892405 RepID=UPI00034CADC4|nr:hypothetical protein [Fortiea contorta]